MNIILYTTHCPRCVVLESKLKQKDIEYTSCEDINIMSEKGFMQAPMLEVDNKVMDFKTANNWINKYEG